MASTGCSGLFVFFLEGKETKLTDINKKDYRIDLRKKVGQGGHLPGVIRMKHFCPFCSLDP